MTRNQHFCSTIEAMIVNGIILPDDAIAEFCRHHGVRRLSLFGSILTPGFTSTSDIDILIEFVPNARIGMLGFAGLALELERMLGRTVDLRTPDDLSYLFRDKVLRSARLLHAA